MKAEAKGIAERIDRFRHNKYHEQDTSEHKKLVEKVGSEIGPSA